MTAETERFFTALSVLSDQMVSLQTDIKADVSKTEAVVRAAVAAAIRDVIHDPETTRQFWRAALGEIQEHAQREAGSVLLAGLRKVVMIGMLLVLAYAIGGGALVSKFWHWVQPS